MTAMAVRIAVTGTRVVRSVYPMPVKSWFCVRFRANRSSTVLAATSSMMMPSISDRCRCAPTLAGVLPRLRIAAALSAPVMKWMASAAIPPTTAANSR